MEQIKLIKHLVADSFNIKPEELDKEGKTGTKSIYQAQTMLVHILHDHFKKRISFIRKQLNRNHATIHYRIKKYEEWCLNDVEFIHKKKEIYKMLEFVPLAVENPKTKSKRSDYKGKN